MSLAEQDMMDVMAFADGELEGEDLARVEKLIASNADAKELLASLAAIGEGVRSAHLVGEIDVSDAVIAKVTPNDLDKARIKRTARTRMAVVAVAFVALAAGVLFYMRDTQGTNRTATIPADSASGQPALASAAATGVQVDFVDTPTPVSVFYLPAENTGAEGKTDTPPSVVVWVDDSMVAIP